MTPSTYRFSVAVFAALMAASLACAQANHPDPATAPFDSEMSIYARIRWWPDPLKPQYVNLGNDQLLIKADGLEVWDIPSNTFSDPKFSAELKDFDPSKVTYGVGFGIGTSARVGHPSRGTILDASTGSGSILLWWNEATREFAAALPIEITSRSSRLLAIGPHHVLSCDKQKGSRVILLDQTGTKPRLVWAPPGNQAAQQALIATGIAGPVSGFASTAKRDIQRPVYFDTSSCRWGITNPPDPGRPSLTTGEREPDIKPYFLDNGDILVSEDNDARLNPPLLWRKRENKWSTIEHTMARGATPHRAGQHEPVLSYSSHSEFVEFLDTSTLKWVRSRQRIPRKVDAYVEPLGNGNALVILRDDGKHLLKGNVGLVAPMRSPMPPERLLLPRTRNDLAIDLTDGSVLLVGAEESSSTRSEIIAPNANASRPIASLPTPLISPHGLALKDGTVLVFGSQPEGCNRLPDDHESCWRPAVGKTFRYFPQEDRWRQIPQLNIPFSSGYDLGAYFGSTRRKPADALVRSNGDLVWIEGGMAFGADREHGLPQASGLKRWRPDTPGSSSEGLAALSKARIQSSLIELADGRLAVVGGSAQLERVAMDKECLDCPDSFVSLGPFKPARSTEILDESNPASPIWRAGPTSHFSGGLALKLPSGRIFKLSKVEDTNTDGYRAEMADAAFTRWEALPAFPVKDAVVIGLAVIGNRVVTLTKNDIAAIWDDESRRWSIRPNWPPREGYFLWPEVRSGSGESFGQIVAISGLDSGKQVLLRYNRSFKIVPFPDP